MRNIIRFLSSKKIMAVLLAVFVITMIVGTLLENDYGTNFGIFYIPVYNLD